MTYPKHTCIEHPEFECKACDVIIHQSEVQTIEYRRQRATDTILDVEDDVERARR